jgi:hypothetical protein
MPSAPLDALGYVQNTTNTTITNKYHITTTTTTTTTTTGNTHAMRGICLLRPRKSLAINSFLFASVPLFITAGAGVGGCGGYCCAGFSNNFHQESASNIFIHR